MVSLFAPPSPLGGRHYPSAVSHQLRFLRNRRIVKSRRAGTVVTYSIDTPQLKAPFREAEYHADHIWHRRPNHQYAKS